MRMFMVGMCDLFLILYLTSIVQGGGTPEIDLTVDDYMKLQAEHQAIQAELGLMGNTLSQSQDRLEAEQKAREAEEMRKQKFEEELARRADALEKERLARLADAKAQEAARLALEALKAEEAKALREMLQKEKQRLASMEEVSHQLMNQIEKDQAEAKRRAAEVEKARQDTLTLEAQLAEMAKAKKDAQEQANKAKREADEARAKAAASKLAEEIAKSEANQALALKDRALVKAKEAETAAFQAKVQAQQALEESETAQRLKAQAFQERDQAQELATEIKEDIDAISRPAEKAYAEDVMKLYTAVHITWKKERKNQFSQGEEFLKLIPVSIDKKRVLLVPLEHLALDPRGSGESLLEYTLKVSGVTFQRVLKHPQLPLVAIVLETNGPSASPVDDQVGLRELSPTLMAIRNGSKLGLLGKLRGLSKDFHVFHRDHLKQQVNFFTLEIPGFRGTGQYGESILEGDQIVDTRGQYLGIAYKDREFLRVTSLDDWVPMEVP